MHQKLSICTAFLAALTLSGCGDWGGGAVLVPTVTFVPADVSGESAGVESAGSADTGAEAPGGVGSFKGRVVMSGAPSLAPLIAKGASVKDKEVCAAVDVPDERLVVSADGGVQNVFVYLPRKPRGTKSPKAGDDMIFDQKNCRFFPHCMIVPTGTTVRVLSDDSVAHNTHSFPSKNDGVNSGVAPGDREGKLTIKYQRAEAEPLQVKCDYHAWMIAYHLPVDHGFAAVTDENGNFEINGLPAGKYQFAVWHEAAAGKFIERKLDVTITGGDSDPREISYPADKLKL